MDAIGQAFTALPAQALASARIASLVPSITELLFVLDLGEHLVARTGFCIHPKHLVDRVAKVGGTKDVQLDKLRALAPTHCIVNVDENTRELVDALRDFVPHVIVTHPQHPRDNLALFALLGGLFHRQAQAQALHDQLSATLATATQRQASLVPRHVLYLIWREPWMTVARNTYIAQMLSLVNCLTLPNTHGGDGMGSAGKLRYPAISWKEDWLGEIDEVWLSSEPYRFSEDHMREVQQLMRDHGHHQTLKLRLVDGELISWYGSRASDGIHYLHQLVLKP
jgi:ABC-type Fe3+-hydroxamate transport system substrate-binding protein